MVTEKMICPPPSIVSLKRREKMEGLMAVEMHRLLGAVNQAGEILKEKQGIFVEYVKLSVGSLMRMVSCFVRYMR